MGAIDRPDPARISTHRAGGDMKAVELDRYGDSDVLQVRDAPAPAASRGEVLVRVRAAALNPKDILVRKGKYRIFTGRRFPLRVGYDWAGEVAEAGAGSPFAAGERLYGMIQAWRGGACAELAAVSTNECARMPEGLSFEQAAGIPLVGLTALQALRDVARIRAGNAVCINGASGGLGTAAIQIAKTLGARVTTLSSEANLKLCRDLGADEALDYRRDDPFAGLAELDCVFDVFGNLSFERVRPALAARSTYVSTVPSKRLVFDIARTLFSAKRARVVVVHSRRRDLEQLSEWIRSGALKPVVDRVWPLEQIREAEDYLATKRARGKVVLTIG
jgi:NADPH:quinone reductase-like Zn-dependent oxidoreductase